MSLDVLRLSSSSTCELACGYCSATQSKKNKFDSWPSQTPKAQKLVLPCNSFYKEDLEGLLQDWSGDFENVSLELHFLTLTLPRHMARLRNLSLLNSSWIVHIDHFDGEKIRNLQIWDAHIIEYRVIPSSIYPPEFFLKHLPDFVQKKMKWKFLAQDAETGSFFELGQIPLKLDQLAQAPLHDFKISQTHWNLTMDTARPPLLTGARWSLIDGDKYTQSDWPRHLMHTHGDYVGYVNSPTSEFLSSLAQLPKGLVYYLKTPAHKKLMRQISFFLQHDEHLYFLENFVARKEVWDMYLKSTHVYDHWTWTKFLKDQNILVMELESEETATSQITEATVRTQAQSHYLNLLDSSFYEKYFFFLHENGYFRKCGYLFFSVFFSLIAYLPNSLQKKTSRTIKSSAMFWDNLTYSLGALFGGTKKLLLVFLNRGFWSTHAKYWQSYSAVNNSVGFVRAISVRTYWLIYPVYWLVYRFISSVYLGTIKSYWALYHLTVEFIAILRKTTIRVFWAAYKYFVAPLHRLSIPVFWFFFYLGTQIYAFIHANSVRAMWFVRKYIAAPLHRLSIPVFWFFFHIATQTYAFVHANGVRVIWFCRKYITAPLHRLSIPVYWFFFHVATQLYAACHANAVRVVWFFRKYVAAPLHRLSIPVYWFFFHLGTQIMAVFGWLVGWMRANTVRLVWAYRRYIVSPLHRMAIPVYWFFFHLGTQIQAFVSANRIRLFWFIHRRIISPTQALMIPLYWNLYHITYETLSLIKKTCIRSIWFFRRYFVSPLTMGSVYLFWAAHRNIWAPLKNGFINSFWFFHKTLISPIHRLSIPVFWFFFHLGTQVYAFIHANSIRTMWFARKYIAAPLHRLSIPVFWFFFHMVTQTVAICRANSIRFIWSIRRYIITPIYRSSLFLYWSAHRNIWAPLKLLGIVVFWSLHRGLKGIQNRALKIYWWIYSRVFTPVGGFFASLIDFPEEIKKLPLHKRLLGQMAFIVKKWGWLTFKLAGLK